ncbi:recombination endonuclease VII [Escherichia phage Killian]|nr:recombination endonuclease VII [Escherichia phage Killian]
MNEVLINDLRLAGYEVNTNGIGLTQIEGNGFILEYEFSQWWLYANYGELIEYVDQFDSLDAALEAAKLMNA